MEKDYQAINVTEIVLLKTLTLVVPLLAGLTEAQVTNGHLSIDLIAKWFLFSAVGIRLLIEGFRFISWMAIGLGSLATISLFLPKLMITAGLVAALYFLPAVIRQAKERPATLNEWMLVLTDAVVFSASTAYLVFQYTE